MDQANPWALGSLGLGLATWVLWFVGFCVGALVPFLGSAAYPLSWATAIAGLAAGFLGYRTAMVTDGSGRASALAGIALNVSWILLQLLLIALAVLAVGGLLGALVLGVMSEVLR